MSLEIKALAADQGTLDAEELERFRRLTEKVADLEAAYAHHLEVLRKEHKDFNSVTSRLDANKKMLAESKRNLEDEARNRAKGFRGEGVSVSFSNPMRVTYSAEELVSRYPQASEIQNLLKTVVDNEVLECAIAAGWVPQRVADQVKYEEPMYKRGRVQVKLLKRD